VTGHWKYLDVTWPVAQITRTLTDSGRSDWYLSRLVWIIVILNYSRPLQQINMPKNDKWYHFAYLWRHHFDWSIFVFGIKNPMQKNEPPMMLLKNANKISITTLLMVRSRIVFKLFFNWSDSQPMQSLRVLLLPVLDRKQFISVSPN